jgi:hypothetical protein
VSPRCRSSAAPHDRTRTGCAHPDGLITCRRRSASRS